MSQQWATIHKTLQEHMQREVYLMRELLSNMHQEEISLMLQDKISLAALLERRASLLDTLNALRKNKQTLLNELPAQLPYFTHSIEINSLYEQLTALSEKIHRQFTINRKLSIHPDRHLAPHHYLYEKNKPLYKTKVITLQTKQ